MGSSEWKKVRLIDAIDFNPTEIIKKGCIAKKIGMDKLNPFQRKLEGYEVAKFTGGTKFRNGDTLLARITPCLENGKTAQVSILDKNEVGFGSTEFIVLREKPDRSINNFIYYLAISPNLRDIAIKSMTGTSGRQRAQKDVIENTIMALPPIIEQKSIALILSTLDDKIEVNSQINRTLEEIAQAIFKHWFVDFEFPNEQGKPYKSSGGEMVESELGMIPKGWEVKKNSDVLKLNYGKALKSKDRQPGKYPVYGSNGIVGFHNKYLVDGPSIVVGRKGNPGTVNYVRDSFFPIDTTFYVSSSLSMLFLYFTLKQQKLYEQGTDSAVPGLNRNIAYMNLMLVPSNNVLKRYDVISASIFQIIKNNQEENSKLIEIRDTLLPKLMSGEIRVSVEKAGVGQ